MRLCLLDYLPVGVFPDYFPAPATEGAGANERVQILTSGPDSQWAAIRQLYFFMIMTAQPGRVKALVPVTLPRPRDVMELQKEPEFGRLVHHIWSSLRDEVQRARQQEHGDTQP